VDICHPARAPCQGAWASCRWSRRPSGQRRRPPRPRCAPCRRAAATLRATRRARASRRASPPATLAATPTPRCPPARLMQHSPRCVPVHTCSRHANNCSCMRLRSCTRTKLCAACLRTTLHCAIGGCRCPRAARQPRPARANWRRRQRRARPKGLAGGQRPRPLQRAAARRRRRRLRRRSLLSSRGRSASRRPRRCASRRRARTRRWLCRRRAPWRCPAGPSLAWHAGKPLDDDGDRPQLFHTFLLDLSNACFFISSFWTSATPGPVPG